MASADRSAAPSSGDSAGGSQNRQQSSHRADRSSESRLSQYQIIKTLGEGSFGKVKLAIHKGTGQKVALKIISRKNLQTRDMKGRVEREIEYLQLLRHPHIIKLYTVIKTPAEIIMVLEFAGGELFDYIVQHGRMHEDEARRFFQQMLCAVEYCHRHKIVHRDLKPENLLLDDNLNVKIADFGLSNIMTDGNFLKTSCGSPNYAAPEVINGKLYAGPEVDVWSCGVILYVLLVGRLPFDHEHIPTLFAKIARGSYMVPTWMSPGAAGLIKKMLVVNPVQRATIDEIRQDPWFLKDLPAYLHPPVEEFYHTGIDPNKAIRPSDIAPHISPQEQQKLHEEVTEKISKTMGYGKQDIEEALESDEPSAIKDAYMIVRENKLMEHSSKHPNTYVFFSLFFSPFFSCRTIDIKQNSLALLPPMILLTPPGRSRAQPHHAFPTSVRLAFCPAALPCIIRFSWNASGQRQKDWNSTPHRSRLNRRPNHAAKLSRRNRCVDSSPIREAMRVSTTPVAHRVSRRQIRPRRTSQYVGSSASVVGTPRGKPWCVFIKLCTSSEPHGWWMRIMILYMAIEMRMRMITTRKKAVIACEDMAGIAAHRAPTGNRGFTSYLLIPGTSKCAGLRTVSSKPFLRSFP